MIGSYDSCKSVIETISARPGLYGLTGGPEAGKTAVMMLFIHILAEEGKKCIVLSLGMSGVYWLEMMKDIGLNTDKVIINVNAHCRVEELKALVKAEKPDMIFIDYTQSYDHGTSCSDKIPELKELAAVVPVLLCSHPVRDTYCTEWMKSENVIFGFCGQGEEMTVVSIDT